METNIIGFINLYKEQDYTSNDAVNVVRGIFGRIKTGHTGTLDPMATGVLPICLGKATKLADYVQAEKKTYRTEMRLGFSTDTGDILGNILTTSDLIPKREEIINAINSFTGEISQIPPMYSAIKINGKRLYELAREGKTVERKPRKITIYSITDITFKDDKTVSFTVVCSKGTYIRTLVADIGEKLKTGAAMSKLERTATGSFTKETAVTIKELQALKDKDLLHEAVIPVEAALPAYKTYTTAATADSYLKNGNKISLNYLPKHKPAEGEVFLLKNSENRLIGIFTREAGFAKPKCMLI